jgi:hypothetical protein
MKQTSHSGKLYGFDNQSNLLTDYESRLLESYSQMNSSSSVWLMTSLSTEAPFGRGVLILVRLWKLRRKISRRRVRGLLCTVVVPSVVVFATKVAVWHTTWLHGIVE